MDSQFSRYVEGFKLFLSKVVQEPELGGIILLDQMVWGLRYSLEGALKRLLYTNTRPLSEEELAATLSQDYLTPKQRSKEPLRMRIHQALTAPHGAFAQSGQGFTLRKTEEDPLHEEVYRLFQNKVPLKQGEILRLLQQRTNRSKGELMSRIDLERDWRFARLEEGDWVLTEWDLHTAGNAANERTEEEVTMNEQTDIVTEIIMELEAYISKLQAREKEIPQDVIRKFESEDLRSIQKLMDERKRVAGMVNDLKALATKWSGQNEAAASE